MYRNLVYRDLRLLLLSLHAHNRQGWARQKAGAQNCSLLCHRGVGTKPFTHFPFLSRHISKKSDRKRSSWVTNQHFNLECQCSKWRFKLHPNLELPSYFTCSFILYGKKEKKTVVELISRSIN